MTGAGAEEALLRNDGALDYLREMEVGEHTTVLTPNLDITQHEIQKLDDGWRVYTVLGDTVEVDWETLEEEVAEVV